MITPKKKWAKVFRAIAKHISNHPNGCHFVCNIIANYEGNKFGPINEFFSALFRPDQPSDRCKFSETGGGWWEMHRNEPRILALLLAAEICERGKL